MQVAMLSLMERPIFVAMSVKSSFVPKLSNLCESTCECPLLESLLNIKSAKPSFGVDDSGVNKNVFLPLPNDGIGVKDIEHLPLPLPKTIIIYNSFL